MKKSIKYLLLSTVLLLVGCNNESSSSGNDHVPPTSNPYDSSSVVDSSTNKLCTSNILISALILSPDSSNITSPTTKSFESIITSFPSLNTLEFKIASPLEF